MTQHRPVTDFPHRTISMLLAICISLFSTPLLAVTKHISLTGADGQALANTTVTIVFPDGTQVDEDTDDRGLLIFDFPNNGNYRILTASGELIQTVSISGAAGSTAAIGSVSTGMVAGVAAVAVAGTIAAAQGDDNDNTGGSSASDVPNGAYNVAFSLLSNPGGHPDLLTGQSVVVSISTSGSSVQIVQTSSVTDFTDISGSISGSTISGSGTGTYSGFSGIQATANLSYDPATNTLSGTYSQGSAGGLPGGQAIVWNIIAN